MLLLPLDIPPQPETGYSVECDRVATRLRSHAKWARRRRILRLRAALLGRSAPRAAHAKGAARIARAAPDCHSGSSGNHRPMQFA